MTTAPLTEPIAEPVAAEISCSFCAKPAHEVAKTVAGPGIYICNECVQICNTILDAEAKQPGGSRSGVAEAELPYWQEMTDEQLLDLLPRIAAVADQVEGSLTAWGRRLGHRGVSWARIGAALEMTRQSAWERFSDRE